MRRQTLKDRENYRNENGNGKFFFKAEYDQESIRKEVG
jgi:hypothetical protein